MNDCHFLALLEQANQPFSGWDFSFITETGRMKSELLSWSYGSMAVSLMKEAHSMLDMGTGGGEFLSKLRPFPELVFATEGYVPNVSVARKKLAPLGVKVVQLNDDEKLPFEDNQFDLILNQHESYSAKEVRRLIKDGGIFLTQQVGGLDCLEINRTLGAPFNDEFKDWNLETALNELQGNNFEIMKSKKECPVQRFYDVGALVYYLKAIPWQVPDFSIEKYRDKLYAIHQLVEKQGYFDVTQQRFFLLAKAI